MKRQSLLDLIMLEPATNANPRGKPSTFLRNNSSKLSRTENENENQPSRMKQPYTGGIKTNGAGIALGNVKILEELTMSSEKVTSS